MVTGDKTDINTCGAVGSLSKYPTAFVDRIKGLNYRRLFMSLLGNQYIDLTAPNIEELSLSSSSKGNQKKFYDHESHSYIKLAFEYQGRTWRDYMVEHLAWRISTMCDTLGITVVKQDVVDTSLGYGCMSKDFSYNSNNEWVSADRLFGSKCPARDIGKSYKVYSILKSMYKKKCDIDIENYFVVMIIMDCLLLNEDRHYNNFGAFYSNGVYSVAPLFDFGLGLFEHDKCYDGLSMMESRAIAKCKPFDENCRKAVDMLFNIGLSNKVAQFIEGIRVPSKLLFPSEKAYEYFGDTIDWMRNKVCSK